MNRENFLLTIAVVAVVLSFVGFSMTYSSVSSLTNFLTGYAQYTENGTLNFTISSNTKLNITHANQTEGSKKLDWGTGYHSGANPAILVTNATGVLYGNWPKIIEGFRLQNIGNTNVTLNISATDDAASFIGGQGALFRINISNYQNTSCQTAGSYTLGTYTDLSTTEINVCNSFMYLSNNNTLQVDFYLKVPTEATSGTHTTIIHFEAS